ncbi:creatininase family protein [Mariprofundus sp. EBB-1]|uniref:creatininase family protein n=1 Tax=Mariprofundus sp. EBB-1 TaxID=2650971 RepID=UPI000EF21E2E|nr:creatininase family protein [Mariprofundus sp. EBB-1]RLL49429.1 creatininase family protein [Mariprofundus sp. EBB-1]
MQLALSTWQEVERYLEHSTGIIIPIGSTEQHGPNGLIGTDAICPTKIASGIEMQTDVLIAPTINYGMAQHHMAFAGTVTIKPSTLIQLICDVVESLQHHGFTHFYFINGHGGNIPPITTAFCQLYHAASLAGKDTPRCHLANWWRNDAITSLAEELYHGAEGHHATVSEVALSYYAHPEAVKNVTLSPEVAPVLNEGENFYDAVDFRNKFPDGRIGSSPQLATVADGERFYHLAVEALTDDYQRFLATL